jgi:hypothetical protein
MKKGSVFAVTSIFFLLGIIIGFLFSPIKNGVYAGNNYHFNEKKEKSDT